MDHETKYTHNVVCPYCGYEDKDSWDIDFGPGLGGEEELQCSSCGEMFAVFRDVEVTYSTWKKGVCQLCDGRGNTGEDYLGLSDVVICLLCKGTGKRGTRSEQDEV